MKNFQSTQNCGVPAAHLAAIETLYRAFNEGDTDLLDQVLTPDWEDIPRAPHQATGREGIKPLIHEFRAAFPDIRIVVHEIIGAPNRAVVRAEIKGTHKGEWFGVAPTGKSFCIAIHEFHYLSEGRITRTWHLEDWFGWLAQVGASQAS